jgi:hypothetical protein
VSDCMNATSVSAAATAAFAPLSRRRFALDGAAVGKRLQDLVRLAPQLPEDGVHARPALVRTNDEVSAPVPAPTALDHVVVDQHADRLLHGGAADAEHRCELPFRWERLAGRDEPKNDLPADLLGHVLVRPLLLEALEANQVR